MSSETKTRSRPSPKGSSARRKPIQIKRPKSRTVAGEKTYLRLKPKAKRQVSRVRRILQIGFAGLFFYFVLTSMSPNLRWDPWTTPRQRRDPPSTVSIREKIEMAQPATRPPSREKSVRAIVPPQPAPLSPFQPKKITKSSSILDYPKPERPYRRLTPGKPKIVIVLDDMGNTDHYQDLIKSLEDKVTYAILPHLPHSGLFNAMSKKTGAEVILHLPLEASDGTVPGPGLLTSRMSTEHARETLRKNLHSVSQHVGVNNHMGSLGTTDTALMKLVFQELNRRDLFFLDSYTTPNSVGFEMGTQVGIPVLVRDVFLDNIDEPQAIRRQLGDLKKIARKKGYAIGIGHYRQNTLKVLRAAMPGLEEEGFELVGLTDILRWQKKID